MEGPAVTRSWLTIIVALLLMSCASQTLSDKTPAIDLDKLQATGDFPEVACLFRTEVHPDTSTSHGHSHSNGSTKTSSWYLWRSNKRIEIQNLSKPIGEVWEKLPGGQVGFTWLHHGEHFAVRYSAADLRLLHNASTWPAKAGLVSPVLLEQLRLNGIKDFHGYVGEYYSGQVGEYFLEVLWLPQLKLPARLKQRYDGQLSRTELIELHALAKSPWHPLPSASYDDMDFADIGDNEAHPLVGVHLRPGMNLMQGEHRH